jgi:tRNA nucleotidyltransferase (CCA-adding enzyme)
MAPIDMKIYTVGGAVRDELLGLPVQDRDFVVVGASPEAMLAKGFKPVGKDFPVFLHPKTHEEYALARTERKAGHGYKGFSFHAAPDVSLADDLARRDLTINAIARADDGTLTDPFNGVADIAAKVLRHVGPAFVEDPVRILRVARFAARFTDFAIAPETLELMRQMVAVGEVDHLVPERVWQELAKGLMEAQPSRMITVLHECGALARLIPELDRLFGVPQRADYHPEVDTGVHVMMALDEAAQARYALPVRFAVLLHDLGKGLTPANDLPRHPGHEVRSVNLVKEVCERLKDAGGLPRPCTLGCALSRRHPARPGSARVDRDAAARTHGRACVARSASRSSSKPVPATTTDVWAGKTSRFPPRISSRVPWQRSVRLTRRPSRVAARTRPRFPSACMRRAWPRSRMP